MEKRIQRYRVDEEVCKDLRRMDTHMKENLRVNN